MSVHDVEATESRLLSYRQIVDALDAPAAILDRDGAVVHRNRWVEGPVDGPILRVNSDLSDGVCDGEDGSSRWRVRPIGDDDLLLITPDKRDADYLLRMFYSGSDLLFVVFDHQGMICEANHAWERLLGYPPKKLEGVDSWSLMSDADMVTRSAVERELREKGRAEPSWSMRHADGSHRIVKWTLRFDRRVGRCFAIGREAAAERQAADELHRRAYADPLTGLANRVRLVAELERASVDGAHPAVLFCDLDGFKAVNDSLGHRGGDVLLEELGRRLDQVTPDSDLVARIGGDEFVVLVKNADLDGAVERAEALLEEVRRPFVIDGRPVHVGASIGVAVAALGERFEAEELLRQADIAVYEAKRRGRNRVVAFGAELRAAIDRRVAVEAGLREALEGDGTQRGAIEVHFQPIVALPGLGTIGVEALMRWRDRDGTLHSPGAFVDVAVEAGLMPAIGEVVMRTALTTVGDIHRGGRPLLLSLNASGTELAAPGFVERFTSEIRSAGVDASLVVLEVTETSALAEDGVVADVLAAVRAAGVQVALDDFGTGYSSLWHLRRFPVDILKIDQSFVRDLVDDPTTRVVTGAIIGLCHELGIDVIVEGVETIDQAAAVEQVGAVLAQGFLFHKPMPVADLLHLLGFTGYTARRLEVQLS